jgi:hypothetical protein
VNLVPKYPFKCSTFLIFSKSLASTVFWVCLACSLHFCEACLDDYTLFDLAYETFFNSLAVNFLSFLKKVSSTLALTPSIDILVEVEMT